MSEFLGFMFFSIFEGIAVFSIGLYLFRIDLMRYKWPVLLVILISNFQNFIIREETSLASVAPIINLLIIVLFLTMFIKIPLIWSLILSIAGFLGLGIIQSAIFYLFSGEFSLEAVQVSLWKTYYIQTLTGLIGFSIGWTLYRFGYGFSFDFEKLRFTWERIVVISLIILVIVSMGAMIYFREVFLNLLLLILALVVLLLYSFRKEDAEG